MVRQSQETSRSELLVFRTPGTSIDLSYEKQSCKAVPTVTASRRSFHVTPMGCLTPNPVAAFHEGDQKHSEFSVEVWTPGGEVVSAHAEPQDVGCSAEACRPIDWLQPHVSNI